MNRIIQFMAITIVALVSVADAADVTRWLSSEDGDYALTPGVPAAEEGAAADHTITVNADQTFQSVLGIGASLEHATCWNLSQLDPATRLDTIRKLVHPEDGIGMNLMRVCIGTSDFVGEPWYSYCDLPEGGTDLDLSEFSIEKDRAYVLPTIQDALKINPDLLIFASPWSPPAWMKTTGSMLGGKLKREYYDVYAQYLVKFIQAYETEGVPIHAITPQNEPGYPNPEYPTCAWSPDDEREFIKDHLGPALQEAELDTLIWCWDHNWNYLKFPRTILSDPEAAQYVDGTGFHLYEGDVTAQSELREEFPDKHIYFTEGSTFRTRGANLIVDIFRNWSRSYNAWVIMLDEDRKPNNGPHSASRTCIERLEDGTVRYNFDYYMYGHFAKFIPRGAVRVATEGGSDRCNHVAFRTPEGDQVLIVANAERDAQSIVVQDGERTYRDTLPRRSVATYRW
jgi:glucosylceramidase